MGLPQSNARVTAILAPGPSEDYNETGGSGVPKWQGSREAYVLEQWKTNYSQSEGGLKRNKIVTMYIPADMVRGFSLLTGDTITYTFNGDTTSRRIQDVTPNIYPGHPLQTYKLNLDLVTVEAP